MKRPEVLAGKTVLCIDNDFDTLLLLKFIFEDRGARVLSASCFQEAVDHVTRETPSVILCDMVMPDTDAISLFRKLQEEGCTAPFVVLTGMSRETCRRADAADFAAYLVKPVDDTVLVSTVAKLAAEDAWSQAA